MSAGDTTLFYANQRVSKDDMDFLADGARFNIQEFIKDLFLGGSVSRVLKSFDVVLGTEDVSIFLGTALGSEKSGGTVNYGQLLAQGSASKTISTSGLGAGDYTIWVRYVVEPQDTKSVVFWDSNTNAEFLESKPTKSIGNWDAKVRLETAGAPGPEWLKIAKFTRQTVPNNDNITLLPQAHLYFEGDSGNSYAAEWGDGVNDRNADRFTYGISNLREYVQALRRQISNIIDDTNNVAWFAVTGGGLAQMARLDGTRVFNTNAQEFSTGLSVTGTDVANSAGLKVRTGDVGGSVWAEWLSDAGAANFRQVRKSEDFVLENWNQSALAGAGQWEEVFRIQGGDEIGSDQGAGPIESEAVFFFGNQPAGNYLAVEIDHANNPGGVSLRGGPGMTDTKLSTPLRIEESAQITINNLHGNMLRNQVVYGCHPYPSPNPDQFMLSTGKYLCQGELVEVTTALTSGWTLQGIGPTDTGDISTYKFIYVYGDKNGVLSWSDAAPQVRTGLVSSVNMGGSLAPAHASDINTRTYLGALLIEKFGTVVDGIFDGFPIFSPIDYADNWVHFRTPRTVVDQAAFAPSYSQAVHVPRTSNTGLFEIEVRGTGTGPGAFVNIHKSDAREIHIESGGSASGQSSINSTVSPIFVYTDPTSTSRDSFFQLELSAAGGGVENFKIKTLGYYENRNSPRQWL